MKDFLAFAAIGTLIILLLVFGPFLFIWSINTLFGLVIPYTLKTWAASLILTGSFGRSYVQSKK